MIWQWTSIESWLDAFFADVGLSFGLKPVAPLKERMTSIKEHTSTETY